MECIPELRRAKGRRQPAVARQQVDGAYCPGIPVKLSLNFTTTSLATTEVSAHSPSPILKSSRLMGTLPAAHRRPG